MPHKRSPEAIEKRRARREAFYDQERAESVALDDYWLVEIYRGEVLHNPTYIHPHLLR